MSARLKEDCTDIEMIRYQHGAAAIKIVLWSAYGADTAHGTPISLGCLATLTAAWIRLSYVTSCLFYPYLGGVGGLTEYTRAAMSSP